MLAARVWSWNLVLRSQIPMEVNLSLKLVAHAWAEHLKQMTLTGHHPWRRRTGKLPQQRSGNNFRISIRAWDWTWGYTASLCLCLCLSLLARAHHDFHRPYWRKGRKGERRYSGPMPPMGRRPLARRLSSLMSSLLSSLLQY